MLFWNNGIKVVDVDRANVADNELQPEYIGESSQFSVHHVFGGVWRYIQKQLTGLYMNFSIESRA